MGNSPSKHLKVHPLLKVGKPWKIWWIFSLQNVLNKKKSKWHKKIDEDPQNGTCFHFSFKKTHHKDVKFCTIGAYWSLKN
jgi:hypothetical protein